MKLLTLIVATVTAAGLLSAPPAGAQFSEPTQIDDPGECQLTRIVDSRNEATRLTDTEQRTEVLDILRQAESAEVDGRYDDCEHHIEQAEATISEYLATQDDDVDEEFMGAPQ